jgi:uncharacterized protein (DUF4415 family)
MTLDKHKNHNISTRKTFSVRIDNDIATELHNQDINLTSLINELLREALICTNVITKDVKTVKHITDEI